MNGSYKNRTAPGEVLHIEDSSKREGGRLIY